MILEGFCLHSGILCSILLYFCRKILRTSLGKHRKLIRIPNREFGRLWTSLMAAEIEPKSFQKLPVTKRQAPKQGAAVSRSVTQSAAPPAHGVLNNLRTSPVRDHWSPAGIAIPQSDPHFGRPKFSPTF